MLVLRQSSVILFYSQKLGVHPSIPDHTLRVPLMDGKKEVGKEGLGLLAEKWGNDHPGFEVDFTSPGSREFSTNLQILHTEGAGMSLMKERDRFCAAADLVMKFMWCVFIAWICWQ